MSMAEHIMAELHAQPPGVPIAVKSLAERLQFPPDEVLAAGEALQQREPRDEHLITTVKRISGDGEEDFYLSLVPLALNDEPETR
jgi:hypothetical protein